MKQQLVAKTRQLQQAFAIYTDQQENRLSRLAERLKAQSPEQRQLLSEQQLSALKARLFRAINVRTLACENTLQREILRLDALSPLKILSRGYSLVYKNDVLLRSSEETECGDELRVVLGSGELSVKVINRKDDEK
jgi:exodeoxyribonuclease VII large subunit